MCLVSLRRGCWFPGAVVTECCESPCEHWVKLGSSVRASNALNCPVLSTVLFLFILKAEYLQNTCTNKLALLTQAEEGEKWTSIW